MSVQRIPTLAEHNRIQRDHAERYAFAQREADRVVAELDAVLGHTSDTHQAALREVMAAGERAAHMSRGYTPEQPTEAQEMRAIHLFVLALWAAFGVGAWATYLYFALAVHS